MMVSLLNFIAKPSASFECVRHLPPALFEPLVLLLHHPLLVSFLADRLSTRARPINWVTAPPISSSGQDF